MRKKLILLVALAVALIVMLLVRCSGRKNAQVQPSNTGDGAKNTSDVVPVKNAPLGTVEALPDDGGVSITIETDGNTEVHNFTDVKLDDWYLDAVNFVLSNGLMNGMPSENGQEKFEPDYGMTRAQLAMILYRFADGQPVEAKASYSDVPEHEWYYDCVNWADVNGYITAKGEDSFGADDFCSCEEVLIILHRIAGNPKSTASLEDYPYAPKVSENGTEAVRWALEKGLIAEDECVWYPTQAVSRAQIALLLMRYNSLVGAQA